MHSSTNMIYPKVITGHFAFIASSLPMVTCSRPKAFASKLYGTVHVSLPSNQTGNNHFVCSFVGFSIDVADQFGFAGTNWENPVPESGTKILTE